LPVAPAGSSLLSVTLSGIRTITDKKTIAFAAPQDSSDNIWALAASGGAIRKLTANNNPRLYFSSLSWSPDSKVIYFGKQSRYSLLCIITNFK
jgi:Tol biopolymer transport system component